MPPKAKESKKASKSVDKPEKTKSKQFSGDSAKIQHKTATGRWKYGDGKTPNKLFISSWNVNGIRAVLKKQDLQKYLKNSKPDIICINQTKINEETFDKEKIELQNYEGYWNFCKVSSGYSGVAIFSKYKPISLTEDLKEKNHSLEGRVLTMEFEKFYLITSYIPNAGQKLDRLQYRTQSWDVAFQEHCEALRKKKTVILCGDLNVCHKEIDIHNPKNNLKTAGFTLEQRANFTKFLQNGWVDTFRELHPKQVKYSWWSMRFNNREKGLGWRLDYFVINKEAMKFVKESSINNDIMGSDHCPIELQIEFK